VPWVETSSPNFAARHEKADDDDAAAVLELLEGAREQLAGVFPRKPEDVTAVVLHSSLVTLYLAQPALPLITIATAPAGRRYLAGWCSPGEIHVLAPRLLELRASAVPGSREMAMLGPATLYTQLVIAANNRGLPPPLKPTKLLRYARWAWLTAGASQYFSGQTAFARPAIARRLREGREPSFPPGIRDAALLGGSVFDLLAREHGSHAAIALAYTPLRGDPRAALRDAFDGRSVMNTAGAWRAHLARLAEQR
jgi:hypothetical protein